jgi:peptide/nickel transport system substrate-binding protein
MMSSGRRRVAALAIALAGVTVIAACSSGSSSKTGGSTSGVNTYAGGIGVIPNATGTAHTGTITYALPPGAVPNWILPLPTSATVTVYNIQSFEWEMWRPLYYTYNGFVPEVNSALSMADAPVWSNGGKTLSITLKNNFKWSDGTPITAKDLLFSLDVITAAVNESPANWSPYVIGNFPKTIVSTSMPSTSTLVINLSKPVNPTWLEENILGAISVMPAHAWAKASASGALLDYTNPANAKKIWDFLDAQSKSVSTYATNQLWQVVSGPYKLSTYNATSGAFTMVPNTTYGGPHAAKMATYQGVPFTSDTAEFNAVKAGSIDIGYVPQTDVPQLAEVKRLGYDYFGIPDFGSEFVDYNFKDTTGHFNAIIKQLYFRQALQHLEDQQGYIKAFFFGAGDPSYGPIPAYPKTPFLPSNAATDPYPYSVSVAVSLLKSHGWTVTAGGTDTCTSPGSGASQCGTGIPAGTKLAFNLIYSSDPAIIGQQVTALASAAKQAGITISLSSSNFNYMISNYNDAAAPANQNKWAMEDWGGETNSTYATQFGFLNTGGSGQTGDYSDPTADGLINASVTGTNPSAVTSEASYLTAQQPVLYQPVPDLIYAWKTNISGDPASFANLTQYDTTPEFWYLTK